MNYTSTKNAPVTFTSSNESIATISNTGHVTGVSEGESIITIRNVTNDKIQNSIVITVQSVPASYSVTITSSMTTPTEINKGRTKTYDALVMNGLDIVSDMAVQWEMYADDKISTTNYAVISNQSGLSCTVRGDNLGYVQLKVSLVDDPSVYAWYRIRIRSVL